MKKSATHDVLREPRQDRPTILKVGTRYTRRTYADRDDGAPFALPYPGQCPRAMSVVSTPHLPGQAHAAAPSASNIPTGILE